MIEISEQKEKEKHTKPARKGERCAVYLNNLLLSLTHSLIHSLTLSSIFFIYHIYTPTQVEIKVREAEEKKKRERNPRLIFFFSSSFLLSSLSLSHSSPSLFHLFLSLDNSVVYLTVTLYNFNL